MTLELFISTYGYAAIAAGAFFEGETILVLGGLAVHQGYLAMPGLLASAYLATLASDQIYFHLGRSKGPALLERRPSWKARSDKVFSLLRRHQSLVAVTFRFFYGLRAMVPFALGTTGIPRLRFLALDMIGAGAWVCLFGTLGYLFGRTIDVLIGDIKRYEAGFFAAVALAGALVWLVHRWPRKCAPRTP
jgi:membrane protein DedA with SNARE-associated domain